MVAALFVPPESDPDIERELAAYAEEQALRLGIEAPDPERHWRDPQPTGFTRSERAHTTLMVSGLTLAHDTFVEGVLCGLGYRVMALPVPDNESLRIGKEFGNRGQCNPTYFTVGNLVKYLTHLRDVEGLGVDEIVRRYVFLTAGACGPCRFGTYVTEYRKALRDAGFDGFRVLLFQQQGGLKQATGEEAGLKLDPAFFVGLVKALVAGDVLNLLGYRIRPYEKFPGATDAALEAGRGFVYRALKEGRSVLWALHRAAGELRRIEVDRIQVRPKVSVIGEFWAMTTEGDGNYHLQRFLEKEGAEVEVQPVTAWILYMIWENRHDTLSRLRLRGADGGRKGLAGKDPVKKLALLWAAEVAIRVVFQAMAHAGGLRGYPLPDMDEVARLAGDHYDNDVRGGEGHLEVGKVITLMRESKAHMVLSVKPFGCMPSSGVSDGVQSLVTELFPELIFLPIETTGDGAVNAHSRIQMMLFRARRRAQQELDASLAKVGLTADAARERASRSRRWRSALAYPRHVVAGTAASVVEAVG